MSDADTVDSTYLRIIVKSFCVNLLLIHLAQTINFILLS